MAGWKQGKTVLLGRDLGRFKCKVRTFPGNILIFAHAAQRGRIEDDLQSAEARKHMEGQCDQCKDFARQVEEAEGSWIPSRLYLNQR